jgi:transaldolase
MSRCASAPHRRFWQPKRGQPISFIHRKELTGEDGMMLIRQIRAIYDRYSYPTKVLAASIRTVKEVLDCLMAGADVATMPFDILEALYDGRRPGHVSGRLEKSASGLVVRRSTRRGRLTVSS